MRNFRRKLILHIALGKPTYSGKAIESREKDKVKKKTINQGLEIVRRILIVPPVNG